MYTIVSLCCHLYNKKDPYLHGLKNIESDESVYLLRLLFMFVFKFRKDIIKFKKVPIMIIKRPVFTRS